MFIEHYNVYIANNTTKKVKRVRVDADEAQIAHKKALLKTNYFTEEITKITDSQGAVAFTIKDGFLETV
jgi:hypothetical protein